MVLFVYFRIRFLPMYFRSLGGLAVSCLLPADVPPAARRADRLLAGAMPIGAKMGKIEEGAKSKKG